MTTGQRIKETRKAAGMTQKELAVKLGIAYQTLAQWENDLRNPKIETLQRIAAALGVDPYSLYSFDQASTALEERINARIVDAASKLSDKGQEKVADYAEDLLPKYPRQQAPQRPAPAPTTPAPEGTEGLG